jgi:hypothetical protein
MRRLVSDAHTESMWSFFSNLPEPPPNADEVDENLTSDHEREHAWEAKELAAQDQDPNRYTAHDGSKVTSDPSCAA